MKNVETFKAIKNMFDLLQTVREDLNPSIYLKYNSELFKFKTNILLNSNSE